MNTTINSDNTVIGYLGDDMTIVEREDGELFYAPVTKELYPIGTVVNDDELFSINRLPVAIQNKIRKIAEE